MKISTRGRYALRVLVDLAEHDGGKYVPLKDIADRQEISLNYLESIAAELSKAGVLDGQHGKGGGYKLRSSPENYTVGDILRITEGDLAPVACLGEDAEICTRAHECRTLSVWKKLYGLVNEFVDGITLADLATGGSGQNDYVI